MEGDFDLLWLAIQIFGVIMLAPWAYKLLLIYFTWVFTWLHIGV